MTFGLEPSAVVPAAEPVEIPLWIAGEARPGHETVGNRAPATGDVLARVHLADASNADAAVAAAVEGQREWAALPVLERARRLTELADRITARADDFGLLDARDTGTPVRTMRIGAQKGAAYLRTCAGVAIEAQGRTVPSTATGWHLTFPRPLGVVVGIAAFNHPTLFACQKIGPALVAGNAVVLKPSEQAPISGVLLAALARDLLPPGVLNVLSGDRVVAQRLVEHGDTAAVTFTGGVTTGLRIQEAAARSGRFKKLVLELGGKNPILVFPDADVEQAASAVVRGMNFTRNQGQSCGATSRLIVHRDLHDELVDRVVAQVRAITLGLPDREDTEMGSLISPEHRDVMLAAIRTAGEEGAKLLAGGGPPANRPDLAAGAYLEPTVFGEVTPEMAVARDELFGPILAIMPGADEAEMIRLANDTEYGLTAAIWTQDIDRALRTADQLDAGYLWINDVETRYPGVPFGGWNQSGTGLEQALSQEILGFTRLKSVSIATRGE